MMSEYFPDIFIVSGLIIHIFKYLDLLHKYANLQTKQENKENWRA